MPANTSTFVDAFIERINELNAKEILPRYFKAPIFGLWELTNKCNLSCIHCYYNANSKGSSQLSTEEAIDVARQLGDLKVFEVYLSGGEPFLRDDWEEIISELRKNEIQVGIITNGTRIDKQIANALARLKVKWIQISIDGSQGELHDYVRGLEGAWERSTQAIQHLKGAGIKVHVSFVPSNKNYFDIGNVIDLCVSLGIEYFVTDMLVLTGRAALNFSDIMLNKDEYKEFFDLVDAAAKKHEDKITIIAPSPEKEALRTYLTMRSATPNIWCIITPEGHLRLDLLLPFTYGNIRRQSIRYIWQNWVKSGWTRPEVQSFMTKYELMSDLVKEGKIPYVNSDIHYE